MTRMLQTALLLPMVLALSACCQKAPSGHVPAPSTQPLADLRDAPSPQPEPATMEQFTGLLEGGIMAIGGETTGWRLVGDGQTGAIEVDVSAVQPTAERLQGRRVTITGRITTRTYVERGDVTVLVASRIDPAE